MFEKYLNLTEEEILQDKNLLCVTNNLLRIRQFSEDFLIKTIEYYDSWICLKTQKNLSPYFCFRYLYDNKTDSADNWTDYYEIINYLNKQDYKYSKEHIDENYNKAMKDREKEN
jgi:hypothetical protein